MLLHRQHTSSVLYIFTSNENKCQKYKWQKIYFCILDVNYFRKQFQSSFTIKSRTKGPRKVHEKWPVRYAFKQDHGYTRTDQQVSWSQSIFLWPSEQVRERERSLCIPKQELHCFVILSKLVLIFLCEISSPRL